MATFKLWFDGYNYFVTKPGVNTRYSWSSSPEEAIKNEELNKVTNQPHKPKDAILLAHSDCRYKLLQISNNKLKDNTMTTITITKEIADKAIIQAVEYSLNVHDLLDDDNFNEYVYEVAKPLVKQILNDN